MKRLIAGITAGACADSAALAIGAAKEVLDDHWDGGDFAADCAGVLAVQIKF